MLTQTGYEHVELDEKYGPVMSGTTMKVVEVALEHLAYGWSPEELKYQHPYLSLGQIYSALAYYYDHKEELDKDIERRLKQIDGFQAELPEPSLRKKLEAKGLL